MKTFYVLEGEERKLVIEQQLLQSFLFYKYAISQTEKSDKQLTKNSLHLGKDGKFFEVMELSKTGEILYNGRPINVAKSIRYKKAFYEMVDGKNENSQKELKQYFKEKLRMEGFDRIYKCKDLKKPDTIVESEPTLCKIK